VDWYPWGPEALERARAEDKPILLSAEQVAACHWCHVMAHESFEDPETAALMNRLFVCVKVDREERPDLDGIYMDAVQAMTGQGGWPMTVFLTPRLVLASRARSWSGRGRSWTVGLLAGSRLVRLGPWVLPAGGRPEAARRAGLEVVEKLLTAPSLLC
jgi:hypothetical protein